jgi:integrase
MRGQIISRGDKTWLLRVSLGRDSKTGTRRTLNKTVHGTKKDAQQELTRVLRERDTGVLVQPSRITLSLYLDRWLETAAKPRVRPRTFADYTNLLEGYVRPTLGNRELSKLTPLDIQAMYTELGQRGLSARTIRYAHAVLHSALSQAVKWRMLTFNPATAVELPRQTKREMQAFSPEQANQFLQHARGDRLETLFLVAMSTGMRPGEYLALQWKEADLDRGAVTVRRTLVRQRDGRWCFEEPKTARSRRTIPLPTSVTRALIEHKLQQAMERLAAGPKYKNHDLIFATATGEPLHEHNIVNRHLKPILKAAGLPKCFRLYDMRHSCATLLLAQGEHPKVVSERLGHASITLTLDTYSHVLPTMQQQAAERLESVLFGSAKR